MMPHIQVWIYSTGICGLTWPDLVFVEMRLNKFPELLKLQWPLAHKLRWSVCVCVGGGQGGTDKKPTVGKRACEENL